MSKYFGDQGNGFYALKDISISFPNIGLVGLVGKSGSGKSTLLNLLSGNEKPSKGKLLFGNKDMSKLKKNEIEELRNSYFGFVYQYFNLIESLTVEENIAMPLLIAGKSKGEALKAAKTILKQFELDYLSKRAVKSLSGGEKQRVALLRATISNPKVVFADEPTGALDEVHGVQVMEYLKKLSETKLVIVVSHNEGLIEKYSDYHLRLKDGFLIESDLKPKNENYKINPVGNRSKSKWKKLILSSHLKSNIKKNIFTVISSTIGLATIMLSIGFFYGSKNVLNNETKRLLTRYMAGISKKETIDIKDSPLAVTRTFRPNIEEVNNIVSENIDVKYDFSYFFPVRNSIKTPNGKTMEVNFIPYMIENADTYNDLLTSSDFEKQGENACLVNTQFMSETGYSLNDDVRAEHELNILVENKKEILSIKYDFQIKGIVSEFSFLNEPKIYYPYNVIFSYLNSCFTDSGRSVMELVEQASPSDLKSNFQLWLFAKNEFGANELESLYVSSDWSISSSYIGIKESFSGIHDALSLSLIPFMVLQIITTVFICGFVSFSTFLDNKKEAAILNSLGARRSSLVGVYTSEGIILSLIGSVIALLLSYPIQLMLNLYFKKSLDLSGLIGIPFGFLFVFLTLLLSTFLGYIGTRIPLRTLYKYPLAEALRNE